MQPLPHRSPYNQVVTSQRCQPAPVAQGGASSFFRPPKQKQCGYSDNTLFHLGQEVMAKPSRAELIKLLTQAQQVSLFVRDDQTASMQTRDLCRRLANRIQKALFRNQGAA